MLILYNVVRYRKGVFMDIAKIKAQTKLDVKSNNDQFVKGHALLIVAAAIAGGVGYGIYYLFKVFKLFDKLHPNLPGTYIFELLLIAAILLLVGILLIYGPIQAMLFGVTYSYPLGLSYKGKAKNKSFYYGVKLTGYTTMKILLYPIVIGLLAFGPSILISVIKFASNFLSLPKIAGTIFSILTVLGLLWTLFVLLKHSLTQFYIADDPDNTLKLKGARKFSKRSMDASTIFAWIKLNIGYWFLQLLFFVPFMLLGGALLILILEQPALASILKLEVLSNLPIDLPAAPALLDVSKLPQLIKYEWLTPLTLGIPTGAALIGGYLLYLLTGLKCRKKTAQANFYNEVKTKD